jgi:putative aldouronate transport system substrate-binding protein
VDELYAAALAFTNNDPDGNGKKDSFGLSGRGLIAFGSIFGAYGSGLYGGLPNIYIKNGQVVSSITDPDAVKAIEAAKRFIDAGIVDPELFANTNASFIRDKAFQGKVGIIRETWSGFQQDAHMALQKAADPKAEWIPIKALKGGIGEPMDGIWRISTPTNMYAISAAAGKNREKMAAITKMLNYIAGEEGSRLVQFGIEGKNYVVENGKVKGLSFSDVTWIYSWQFIGRDDLPYLSVRFPNQIPLIEFAKAEPRIQILNGFVDYPEGFIASDAATYAEQELIKFLYGKRPLSEYNDYVKTMMELYKLKAWLDSAPAQIAQFGFNVK